MIDIARRSLLLGASVGALLAPLGLASARTGSTGRQRQPNIIFLLADDLGYADIGVYGRDDIATPNLDKLAAGGVQFMQAYANSSVCSATRTALMTGRYQYRLPIGLEEPLTGGTDIGLPPELSTLPSLLRLAGYETGLIGKWHLGPPPHYGPLKSGYDRFFGFHGGGVDYFRHVGSNNKPDLWDGETLVQSQNYLTDMIGDKTIEFMRSATAASRPYFASVHFNAPHWPWEGPDDKAESDRLGGKNLGDYEGGSQKIYRTMIERMDYQIGRILDALKASGAEKDTIVIFTSDNGGERFAKTWPFTGMKGELLEGGIRIPAIVRWPQSLPAGIKHDQVNITMDWVPSLLTAASAMPEHDAGFEGVDLFSIVRSGSQTVPRTLFWRHKANGQRAMRQGDFKILKMRENSFLFNVVEDPLERANLKSRQSALYETMTQAWDVWNTTMLAETPQSASAGYSGAQIADHLGAQPPSRDVDSSPWPAAGAVPGGGH